MQKQKASALTHERSECVRALAAQWSADRLIAVAARAGGLVVFALVLLVFAVQAPFFLSIGNLGLILGQSAILGILGLALTIVVIAGGTNIVTGGIDLSLAGNLGLSAAIFATLTGSDGAVLVPVLAALACGALIGLLNALAIAGLRILPLLATLAIANICSGFELVLTENTTVAAVSSVTDFLMSAGPLNIPVLGYVLLLVAALLTASLHYTVPGLRLQAVGSHRPAARAAGLSVRRYVAAAYVLSGLLGGLGGILSVAFLGGASPGSGDMLLPVVLTAFLGAIFSRRLVPNIPGSLLAALFVGMLMNGFQLLHLSSYWVNAIEGVLILAVVAATGQVNRAGEC